MNAIDETQHESQENDSQDSLKRAMADAARDAILAIDEQANILAANHSALGMLGYSRGELRGQNLAQIIAPRDRDRITRRVLRDLLGSDSQTDGNQSNARRCTKQEAGSRSSLPYANPKASARGLSL